MSNAWSQKRHPENRNLILHEDPEFHSMSTQQQTGPLIRNYLERIERVIQSSLSAHSRVTALRYDLRLPEDMHEPQTNNRLMTEFWERLKDRIESDRARARRELRIAHDTTIEYLWTREYDQAGNRPHWHCVLLVNKDAYYGMGWVQSKNQNMYQRIASAWSSALGLTPEEGRGLVHIPHNPVYHIRRNSDGSQIEGLFHRLSYFAKMKSKRYEGTANAFGSSRALYAQTAP